MTDDVPKQEIIGREANMREPPPPRYGLPSPDSAVRNNGLEEANQGDNGNIVGRSPQEYYLTQPPKWSQLEPQQHFDDNEEEKVGEEVDLEIPSPRAEVQEEEDEEEAKRKAQKLQNFYKRQSKIGQLYSNHQLYHHSRNQEKSNNLQEIKEHQVMEQIFSVNEGMSFVGAGAENMPFQKPLLEANRVSADYQHHIHKNVGGFYHMGNQFQESMISGLQSFISEGQPEHTYLLPAPQNLARTKNGEDSDSDDSNSHRKAQDGSSNVPHNRPNSSQSSKSIRNRELQAQEDDHTKKELVSNQVQEPILSEKQKSPVKFGHLSSWKYIEQPTLTRLQSIIYHKNRSLKLELDLTIRGRPGVLRPALISQEQLDLFYQTRVKNFPHIHRELEIVEEPRGMYEADQNDLTGVPEIEKKILANIQRSIEYQKIKREEQLKGPPIVLKYIRSSHLFFNSNFESGNLREVEQVTDLEYNLYLNFDFNTQNYTQWYFFSVRNIRKGFNYTFNIMNLQKEESSYNQGMKPFVYSVKKNKEHDTNQWTRGGENIDYYKNNLKIKKPRCTPDYEYYPQGLSYSQYYDEADPPTAYLNTLSFNFQFDYDEDIVFFSQFQPYTYEDLKDYLHSITKKYPADYLDNILKVQKLCNTIEGNTCHILTISDSIHNESQQLLASQGKDPKQVVFLTSRVHPGESNSQFMVQGTIEYLLAQTKEAQYLREHFIFKIVPMLNPDGVIRGNYRCNTLGVDLNRRWSKPSKILHPTIYYCKYLIKQFGENQIIVFCDMHGHSRKRNVFMYGCISPQNDLMNHKYNNLIRMIPYMLGQRNKLFQFNDCKFANEKDKDSTARFVMFREFSIINSYTLESTFYAPYNNQFKKKKDVDSENHVKAEELVQVGGDLCLTIYSLLQSKILRRKFLQQEGPTGNIIPGPPIGFANVQNIVINLPPVQTEKPKISDIYRGLPISSTTNGEGTQTARDGQEGANLPTSKYFPLPGSKERTVGTTQYTNLGSIYPHPQTASSKNLLGDQGSPVNGEALKGQPLSKVIASLPQTHQNMVRDPELILQYDHERDMIQQNHHPPVSIKKRSHRNNDTNFSGTQEVPQILKIHHHLLPPTIQKTPLKHKIANKIATSLNGHAAMTAAMGGFPMPMTIIAQPTPLQLQAKAAMKTNIMKQSILEAPNQVNAVLSDQFVPLSKVMGTKIITQQDFFKLYHAGGNFRTVMNSNIIHSPTLAAAAQGIGGSQSNSNLIGPVTNNHPQKKVGASIHIITESPTRQTQSITKSNNNFPNSQSSSNIQYHKGQNSARGDQEQVQQQKPQRNSNKQEAAQQQLFGLGQGPPLPLSALLGEALGDIQSHPIPQVNSNGDKLPYIVNKTMNRKKHHGDSTDYVESPSKHRQTTQSTPLKFAEIQQNKGGGNQATTTQGTRYIEPFFKQNDTGNVTTKQGVRLQQAGNQVTTTNGTGNNNRMMYGTINGNSKTLEPPVESPSNRVQHMYIKQKGQLQISQGQRRNIIEKLNSLKLLQPAGQQLISQSSSILQTGTPGGSPEAGGGRPSNPPLGAFKKNQQGKGQSHKKGTTGPDFENQIVYQDYISTPQKEYAETDYQALFFSSSPNLQNGNQILSQTQYHNLQMHTTTYQFDPSHGDSRVNLPNLINGAKVTDDQQNQQKFQASNQRSRDQTPNSGAIQRMRSNEDTAGKPPKVTRTIHQMASAEIGLSFQNSPHPLYIKDGGDVYESGGSPNAKFYSSRPELENEGGENLRSKSILQKVNTDTGGVILNYARINDGRGGEFRIFKSPLKPVNKRESRAAGGDNVSEDLRLFAKLKVKHP